MIAHLVTVAASAWPAMAGAAVRAAVLFLFAGVAVHLRPRASAAQRHLVWALACCGTLLVPALRLVIPAWDLPVLPAPAVFQTRTVVDVPVPPEAPLPTPHDMSRAAGRPAGRPAPLPAGVSLAALLVMTWGIGTLTLLYVLLRSQHRVRHLLAEATPLADPHVLALFADVGGVVGLTRRTRLYQHRSTIPMTCGVFRPVIVLPASAGAWEDSRLRHVLLHEAAHVKRYDALVQTVASVVCALYWFNPLAWVAVRRLRTERERACDDAVLAAEGRPSEYATDLLVLTHTFRLLRAASPAALTFACVPRSQMQARLHAIIDVATCRTAVSRRGVVAAGGALLGVVYPLVGVTPVPRRGVERPPVVGAALVWPTLSGPCRGHPCAAEPLPTLSSTQELHTMRHGATLALAAATLTAAPSTPRAAQHQPPVVKSARDTTTGVVTTATTSIATVTKDGAITVVACKGGACDTLRTNQLSAAQTRHLNALLDSAMVPLATVRLPRFQSRCLQTLTDSLSSGDSTLSLQRIQRMLAAQRPCLKALSDSMKTLSDSMASFHANLKERTGAVDRYTQELLAFLAQVKTDSHGAP